jgi:hypothetical protein
MRLWQAAENLRLQAELRKARELLQGAGVAHAVLKGQALLGRYPSGGLRPMEDADVLVEPGALARAGEVLGGAGYRPHHEGVPGPGAEAWIAPSGASIDLHARLLNPRIPLWRELVREPPGGWWAEVEEGRLAPAAELAFVAAHAGKHRLIRDRWLADLALLIGGGAPVEEAVALGMRLGVGALMRAPLWATREVLGLRAVRRRTLATLGELTPAEARLVRDLGSGERDMRDNRLAYFLPMVPGCWRRLRVIRATALPSPAEARARFGAESYPRFLWGRVRRALVGAA